MAVTFTGAGTASAASGASPQAVTTAVALAVGDYLVVLISYDNSGGGGADPMSGTITVTPASGSLGASVSAQTGLNDPGTASSGLAARCVVFPVTGAIASSTSCNVAWSGTVVVRAVSFMKVSSGAVIGYRTNSGATGANTVASAGPALTTPSVTNGEGVLCWGAYEYGGVSFAGDADTTNGTWSAIYGVNTGSALSGQSAYFQSKVVTATATQAWNPTGTSSDWILGCLIFTETPLPTITQAAYRIYDDGTETGAVALAAQDTAANGDITSGDGIGQLRIRLQSTNAGVLNATDDYQLQWDKNASGSWTDVTTGGTTVKAYNSASLTDAAATTNRLGAGTGSFVVGKLSEDGLVDNLSWSSNNYTELLFTVQIVKANVTVGDVITFRVLRNGATTGMTYTAVPTVNVVAITVTQAAYRFYADGTETGSTALAAQDTVANVDTASSDQNLQLRMRLQSTGGAPLSTDDWQLQYSKAGTSALSDSYPIINWDDGGGFSSSYGTLYAQSFLGDGNAISRAGICIDQRTAGSNGIITAYVFAHTGTYGGGGPTGAALTTSTTTINCSTISTTPSMVYFDFDATLTLTNGTPYCVVFETTNTGSPLYVGLDYSDPTHAGCASVFHGSPAAWEVYDTYDLIFEVYTKSPATAWANVTAVSSTVRGYNSANLTDAAVTTNRMTGGTGTFVAGKLSEDGLVDDVGWTAGNYTELLYSITLKQADLTAGDVLQFQVLRNGATTWLTYTAVPQVSIATPVPTGTVVETLANTTSAAFGTHLQNATGTVVETLDNTTSAVVAKEDIPGTVARTLANTTSAVVATEGFTGTLARTLANVTSAVTAVEDIPGTSARTLGNTTSVANGTSIVPVTGTVARTLDATTSTASGTSISPPVTGTAAGTLGNTTAAATGVWAYAIPQNVVATSTGISTIQVTWDAIPTATGFDIERDAVVILLNHPASPFNDSGLSSGVTYNYRVRAVY